MNTLFLRTLATQGGELVLRLQRWIRLTCGKVIFHKKQFEIYAIIDTERQV